MKGGKVEYLLKWEGYSEQESTWEREEDLNCPELIAKYEEEHKNTQPKKRGRKGSSDLSSDNGEGKKSPAKKQKKDGLKISFEWPVDGVVEEIIGARKEGEALHLFVKWKGSEERTFVPAQLCNEQIPQQVISFYESRLKFEPVSEASQQSSSEKKMNNHDDAKTNHKNLAETKVESNETTNHEQITEAASS